MLSGKLYSAELRYVCVMPQECNCCEYSSAMNVYTRCTHAIAGLE